MKRYKFKVGMIVVSCLGNVATITAVMKLGNKNWFYLSNAAIDDKKYNGIVIDCYGRYREINMKYFGNRGNPAWKPLNINKKAKR